ncbi:MAG TPA: dockerin type I domain-containing protein [Fimbriimonadaceae bacterium]|nr:dockerin type I domain-containing protein [Fimbriimonadaceae bacterium]HRJ95360.1 dockerin type I domain-containing protein [Fimbriimonadaceae bacterium]
MKYRAFAFAACAAASLTTSMAVSVAICAAANSTIGPNFTDPQTKLLNTGLFTAVDIINATSATPTLAQLQAYDAVLVWSNVNFQSNVALGDVLADYVDSGGGVVVSTFANSTTTANRFLAGRWLAEANTYECIVSQGGNTSGTLQTLGTVLDPLHPIMNGVATFSGGTSSFRPNTTAVRPGATKIALWSDGRTLVAVGPHPRRADLGFYPPSNAVSASWWDQNTDGAKLMANALRYVSRRPSVSGTAILEAYEGPTAGGSLVIEVWQGAGLVETLDGNYGAGGSFTCTPTAIGPATLKFRFHTSLVKGVSVVLGSQIENLMVELFNGDCDHDNEVAIGDFAIISTAFGTNEGDPGYDTNGDTNGDGSVDIGDFAIMSFNFGMVGD